MKSQIDSGTDLEEITKKIQELILVLKRLRAPDGCPWDREQTPETIKKYLIEEAYELYEAVENNNEQEVKEELGDLLFLLLFLADLYQEKGAFTLAQALSAIKDKMVRRHPHIFGSVTVRDSKDVVANWQAIKGQEAKEKGIEKSILGNLPKALPALQRAYRIGERASRVGFDWIKAEDVLDKIHEEIKELEEALKKKDPERVEEEVGDLLFSVANLSRKLNLNPEETLKKALCKFQERFKNMEREIASQGLDIHSMNQQTLEKFWQQVKDK